MKKDFKGWNSLGLKFKLSSITSSWAESVAFNPKKIEDNSPQTFRFFKCFIIFDSQRFRFCRKKWIEFKKIDIFRFIDW